MITNPLADCPAQTLHPTGLVARLRPGGGIEVRPDGVAHSSEQHAHLQTACAHIQSCLAQHLAVTKVIAVADTDEGIECFVIPASGHDNDHLLRDLKKHLRQQEDIRRLPKAIYLCEHFPLTPKGEVNIVQLRKAQRFSVEKVPPAGPTETAIADIWTRLLKRPAFDRNDSFFALGGNSILATQLVSRLRAQFSIDIPVSAVFEHQTIASLRVKVEALVAGAVSSLPSAQDNTTQEHSREDVLEEGEI